MNLKEFIDNNQYCVFCNNKMSLYLNSFRSQKASIKDNYLIFNLSLKDLHTIKSNRYVNYCFDLNSDDFGIFFENDTLVNLSSIISFYGFHDSFWRTGNKRILKTCPICCFYSIESNDLMLDFKKGKRSHDINVDKEIYIMKISDNKYDSIVLESYPTLNKSEIIFFNGYVSVLNSKFTPGSKTTLSLPYIPFKGKIETQEKIMQYLIFS